MPAKPRQKGDTAKKVVKSRPQATPNNSKRKPGRPPWWGVPANQDKFCEALASADGRGNIAAALRIVGKADKPFYKFKDNNPAFAKAVTAAQTAGQAKGRTQDSDRASELLDRAYEAELKKISKGESTKPALDLAKYLDARAAGGSDLSAAPAEVVIRPISPADRS